MLRPMKVLLRGYHSTPERKFEFEFNQNPSGRTHVPDYEMLGWYDKLGDRDLGFFVLRKVLYFLIDGIAFEFSEISSVDWSYVETGRVNLTIVTPRGEVSWSYEKPIPVSTIYWSEDDEDADFGLRVFNLSKSPMRRAALIEGK